MRVLVWAVLAGLLGTVLGRSKPGEAILATVGTLAGIVVALIIGGLFTVLFALLAQAVFGSNP